MRSAYERSYGFSSNQIVTAVTDFLNNITNTISEKASVLTNIPQIAYTTNGYHGFFGTNAVHVRTGGTNIFDVGNVMAGHLHTWRDKVSNWTREAILWLSRCVFAFYLLWSLVDMGRRFISTKPGDHSISVSNYVGFSAGWAAPAAFWAMILTFYAVTITAHSSFYAAYYGVTITAESGMATDVASKIASIPTGGPSIPGAGQFITGMTGTETSGTIGNAIKWFYTEIMNFINGVALLQIIIAWVVFTLLRQALYTIACSVASSVAMAL